MIKKRWLSNFGSFHLFFTSIQGNFLIADDYRINYILWADDIIILFSDSEKGLKKLLEQPNVYSYLNQLEINTDETKFCLVLLNHGLPES